MANIGDYVTGKLIGTNEARQGVLTRMVGGTATVEGQLDRYLCDADVTVVPDRYLDADTLAYTQLIRLFGLAKS